MYRGAEIYTAYVSYQSSVDVRGVTVNLLSERGRGVLPTNETGEREEEREKRRRRKKVVVVVVSNK